MISNSKRCKVCNARGDVGHRKVQGGHICRECYDLYEYDDNVDCATTARSGEYTPEQELAVAERLARVSASIRARRAMCGRGGNNSGKVTGLREYVHVKSRRCLVLRSVE